MRTLALGCVAAALSGCSLHVGASVAPSTARARPSPTPLAIAQATHEYPGPPVHERAVGTVSDPALAVRSFARAYINWSAATVRADMQALAARSVGQARSALELAAAQTAQDYELQRGGVSNHGTVEAVAPLAGHPDEFIVVTREGTTASNTAVYQGLAPAWHVALATVTEVGAGDWAVSGWQPQS
jgi:hypothetical protein